MIRTVQHRKFISCRDIRCKKGKSKRIENIKKLDQVCCHLRLLLDHLKFGSDNSCVLEDSDEEDAGTFLLQVQYTKTTSLTWICFL